jgi:hypothetical protein
MPFTLSHAAAVLPFRRTRLIWSALVIGSCAPDFEYFLRLTPSHRDWHEYPNVLLFCIPFACFLLWMWQTTKRYIVELFPVGLRRRLATQMAPLHMHDWKVALNVVLSLAIGLATHIAWDLTTHMNTWPYRHVRWLRMQMREPMLGSLHFGFVRGCVVLQDVSSLVGLLVLGIAFAHWYATTEPAVDVPTNTIPNSQKIVCWTGFVVVAATVATISAHSYVGRPHSPYTTEMWSLFFGLAFLGTMLWLPFIYGAIRAFAASRNRSRVD